MSDVVTNRVIATRITGTTDCSVSEYRDEGTGNCQACFDICRPHLRRVYDECKGKCQAYLRLKAVTPNPARKDDESLESVYIGVAVGVGVVVLVVAAILVYVFICRRTARRHGATTVSQPYHTAPYKSEMAIPETKVFHLGAGQSDSEDGSFLTATTESEL